MTKVEQSIEAIWVRPPISPFRRELIDTKDKLVFVRHERLERTE